MNLLDFYVDKDLEVAVANPDFSEIKNVVDLNVSNRDSSDSTPELNSEIVDDVIVKVKKKNFNFIHYISNFLFYFNFRR